MHIYSDLGKDNKECMVRYSFVFFIVFVIGLILAFSKPIASSVVPGWHTTIYPPFFFISVIQLIWLGVVSLIYTYLETKGIIVKRKTFMVHLLLSLTIFLENVYVLSDSYIFSRLLLLTPYILFLIAQIIFVLGILKAKRPEVD
jgi:hypothetical protein